MADFDKTELDADFAEMREGGPISFQFLGADYTGVRGALTENTDQIDPGYIDGLDSILSIQVDEFSVLPDIGDLIVFNAGQTYALTLKVVKRSVDPLRSVCRLWLASPSN